MQLLEPIIASSMFAPLALYGYFTRTDLTSMRNILFYGFNGLMVNLFLKSAMFNFALSALGALVFAALTAYDVQRIKLMSYTLLNEGTMTRRVSIAAALALYLDFLNLFLSLLTFTGKQREQ